MSENEGFDFSNVDKDEQYRLVYGDDYVDITPRVTLYEKGKVFKCDCGQDIGIELNKPAVKCEGCGRYNVDKEAEDREPPNRGQNQSGLGDFL